MGSIISSLQKSDSLALVLLGHTLYVLIYPVGFVIGGAMVFGGLAFAGCWMVIRLPFVLVYNAIVVCRNAWRKRKLRRHSLLGVEKAAQTDTVPLSDMQSCQTPTTQPDGSFRPKLTVKTSNLPGQRLRRRSTRSLKAELFS